MSVYRDLKKVLSVPEIDNPGLEARILLRDLAGVDETLLMAGDDIVLDPVSHEKIADAVRRRVAGEPLSRILGFREFWGLRFALSPDTLDPRPDSETLVEAVLRWARGRDGFRILDLGTGSGCLLLSLLSELPESTGVGVDLAPGAVAAARDNADSLGLSDRAAFQTGDWFDGITERFDIVISNPPYIRESDVPILDIGVRNHDPILALTGGDDGLGPYKIIIPALNNFLKRDGAAFLEIGIGQADDIARLVKNAGATLSRIWPDLGGIPRVVEISTGDN